MISLSEYETLIDEAPPDNFDALLMLADDVINQATLYGLIGRDVSGFPSFVQNALRFAYAHQIQYLSRNEINEFDAQSVTLGKFSISAASESNHAKSLSPMAKQSLITVNVYLRGLKE